MFRKSLAILIAVFVIGALAAAQDVNPLKPPKGYKVALVEFADYECPDCANAEPILEQAERTYHIPLVRYDFPLTNKHPWAMDAAIAARFFDSKSKALGDEFRKYCYDHQPYADKQLPHIETPQDLQQAAARFAAQHKIVMPMALDPQGRLRDAIERDMALGREIPIDHTPTIYVVTNSSQGKPFVEVVDRSNLFSQIDEMISEAGGVRDAATVKTSAKSSHRSARKTH